jgi:tRNA pseudouridine38-40 synthase
MRYALGIEYDGSSFLGWQRLSHGESVQGAVEAALATIVQHPVDAVCAGRTDAGVHATQQVVHLDTDVERPLRAFVEGTNTRLPPSVRVLWAQPIVDAFHARHSARARRYRYRLLNRRVRPALLREHLSWEPRPLDAEAMHRAAQSLLGENDFSAFRTAQCQARHPMRDLQSIVVRREDDQVIVEVQANAFLHHMVRNIVGSLMVVGRGEQPDAWIAELLAGRDRTVAGPTAPAAGLTFLGPRYPRAWGLPEAVCLPEGWVDRPRPLAVLPFADMDA